MALTEDVNCGGKESIDVSLTSLDRARLLRMIMRPCRVRLLDFQRFKMFFIEINFCSKFFLKAVTSS